MQELIQKLQEKAGITAEQAEKSIDTMKDFIKSKLPAAIAGNVDTWFAGIANQAETKKESFMDKAEDFLDEAGDKVEDWANAAKDKISGMFDKDKK
ncbi:hypothetical protein COR50_07985 [Chitinophaga caeni]|uniref:YtxH domain-containing protein n=1 Tax=Chitinophaga caeni TaxID=2029983 RepID=A0A291QSX4_9BACT|nr:hypothetical protein [Chitinophaga caeni]ATL47129.1 hypothetical protein COR50_07985 [Chitinophaga caeni]